MKILSLRLPDDVHAQLKDVADAECRSLTQAIEYAIRRYLAAYAEQGPTQVKPRD